MAIQLCCKAPRTPNTDTIFLKKLGAGGRNASPCQALLLGGLCGYQLMFPIRQEAAAICDECVMQVSQASNPYWIFSFSLN